MGKEKDHTPWVTVERGIRKYDHLTRKHGLKPDVYYALRYRVEGKRYEEGLGWASQGWTLERARLTLAELMIAKKTGAGEVTLRERRVKAQEEREEAKRQQEARKRLAVTLNSYWHSNYFPDSKQTKAPETWRKEESNFKTCFTKTLDQIVDTIEYMLSRHSKVLSVRIDIQSAIHTKTPLTSMDITRIIESAVRTLDAKASKGKNDPDIHYVWTSEKTTPDDIPHFHLNFFANANAIQNGYAFKDAISIAVKRRLQTTYDGLVNFSDSNGTKGKLIERNSPDVYAQIDAVVYAASYLAKVRSKEFNPKWSRVSSCTRITRRTLSDSIR